MSTILAAPSLYVAYSEATKSVRWFEVTAEEEEDLADDLSQLDADGIRRAYRRLDGRWFAFLHAHANADQWAPIRARMIEIVGAEKVAKGEAPAISFDYRTPQVVR